MATRKSTRVNLCIVIIDPTGIEQQREVRSDDETRFKA